MITGNYKFVQLWYSFSPLFFFTEVRMGERKFVISGLCHIKKKKGLEKERKHEFWHIVNEEVGEPHRHLLCYPLLSVSPNLKDLSWLFTQEWICWVKGIKESISPLRDSGKLISKGCPNSHSTVVCTGSCSTLEHLLKFYQLNTHKKIVFPIGLDSHFPAYNVNWPYATHFCKIPAMAFACAFPGLKKFSINFW